MAKGVIYRRKRYQCCQCGKDVMKLPLTVSNPNQVKCLECSLAEEKK